MVYPSRMRWFAVIGITVLLGACLTYEGMKYRPSARGILFAHAKHADTDCDSCHSITDGEPTMPNHDVCSVCHDIDITKPSPEACGFCHTEPDQTVQPRKKVLSDEQVWRHQPHLDADVSCATCHANPDKGVVSQQPLKPFCMDCHEKKEARLNECPVCHSTVRKDVVPQYRYGARIQHDAPQIWENIHGQEAMKDQAYCALCHDQESSCEECHRTNPPKNHTIAWKRQTHGLQKYMALTSAKCSSFPWSSVLPVPVWRGQSKSQGYITA